MQPVDMMKLIYQRVFGCGHLVTDFDKCLAYVNAEYAACAPGETLLEPLGNGFSRLYLGNAREMGVSARHIARLFFLSAAPCGTKEEFLAEAEKLMQYADAAAIDALIAQSKASDFAPFSHSAIYREAYHPAYRVILTEYRGLLPQ